MSPARTRGPDPADAIAPKVPPEPRLDLVPQLTVVAERRGNVVVLRVPKYRGWGARVAKALRLPVEKRVVLDAQGSAAIGLVDGDASLGAIAEAAAGRDPWERARLFSFLALLAARGWLTLQEPGEGKRL